MGQDRLLGSSYIPNLSLLLLPPCSNGTVRAHLTRGTRNRHLVADVRDTFRCDVGVKMESSAVADEPVPLVAATKQRSQLADLLYLRCGCRWDLATK